MTDDEQSDQPAPPTSDPGLMAATEEGSETDADFETSTDEEAEADKPPVGAAADDRPVGAAASGAAALPTAERRQATKAGVAPASIAEQAVHIDDRISTIYVLAAIAVFVAILLFGIVGGRSGFLTSDPPPSTAPTASTGASPSP
jgi:hypothetical protein